MEPRSYRQKTTPFRGWVVLGLLTVAAVAVAGVALSAVMGPDSLSGWGLVAGFLVLLLTVTASFPIVWLLASGLGRIVIVAGWLMAIVTAALVAERPSVFDELAFGIFTLVFGVLVTIFGGLVVIWALAAGSGRLELDAEEIRYYHCSFASGSLGLRRLRWREIRAVRIVRNLFGSHAFSTAYLSAPGRVTQRIIISRFEDSQALQADLLRAVEEVPGERGNQGPSLQVYDLHLGHLLAGAALYGGGFFVAFPWVFFLGAVILQLGEAGDAVHLIAALIAPAAFACGFWIEGLLALTSGPPRTSDVIVIGVFAGLVPALLPVSELTQPSGGLCALVALGAGIAGAWIWTRLVKPRVAEPPQ